MDIITCPNCGASALAEEKFCSSCGYNLHAGSAPQKAVQPQMAGDSADDKEKKETEEYVDAARKKLATYTEGVLKPFSIALTIAGILTAVSLVAIIILCLTTVKNVNDGNDGNPHLLSKLLCYLFVCFTVCIGAISFLNIFSNHIVYMRAVDKIKADKVDVNRILKYAAKQDEELSGCNNEWEKVAKIEMYSKLNPKNAATYAKNTKLNGDFSVRNVEKHHLYQTALLSEAKGSLDAFRKATVIKTILAAIIIGAFIALCIWGGKLLYEIAPLYDDDEVAAIAKGYLPRAIMFGAIGIAGIVACIAFKIKFNKNRKIKHTLCLKNLKEEKILDAIPVEESAEDFNLSSFNF